MSGDTGLWVRCCWGLVVVVIVVLGRGGVLLLRGVFSSEADNCLSPALVFPSLKTKLPGFSFIGFLPVVGGRHVN